MTTYEHWPQRHNFFAAGLFDYAMDPHGASQMSPGRRAGRGLLALALALVLLAAAAPATASAGSIKKAIWGPGQLNGVSQFPIYQDLGVGIYQTGLVWSDVAPTRPTNSADPNDPAYRWPRYLDFAVQEANRTGIRVAVNVTRAPAWANGGRSPEWAPTNPREYAAFLEAVSRRYPSIRHWIIWSEAARSAVFKPLPRNRPTGPRIYARLVDAAYARLKSLSRRHLIIGGNTFSGGGEVKPYTFLRYMRLKNGKPPRMDLYGHNPFGPRKPDLSDRPLAPQFIDFGDLDGLMERLDRTYRGRRLRIFLSEYTMPMLHRTWAFGDMFTSEPRAAEFLRAALAITRRTKRIYTLGWFTLYDEEPRPAGDEGLWGLLDLSGRQKPVYFAYKNG